MTTTRQSLKSTWQRLLRAASEQIALLHPADQTRLSWAKSIRTVDEIPAGYQAYLHAQLPALSACLPAVLTPTYRGFMRQENEKLVFTHDERLHILEFTPAGLSPTIFPHAEINNIEVGMILLKAWLRVSGLSDGALKTAVLKYNSVTQYLFDPLVAHLRRTLSEAERSRRVSEAERNPPESDSLASLRLEQARFAPLQIQSFKFMNYARHSLQPLDRVIAYTLQPELRLPGPTLLGRPLAMRIAGPAHLCILTTSELILIREDPTSPRGHDDAHYGGVWDYLPINRLRSASLEQRPTGPALLLGLPGDDRFEILFSPASQNEAERLCAHLQPASPAH